MLISKCFLCFLMVVVIVLVVVFVMVQFLYFCIVFIGDSLIDVGYFCLLLFVSVQLVIGQFIINLGWIYVQYVFNYYGINGVVYGNGQGGDNYVIGGVCVGVDVSQSLVLGILVILVYLLKIQIVQYLVVNGGKVDVNVLYIVWGGVNDIFVIQGGVLLQVILGVVVIDQVGIVVILKGVGVQYIVVLILLDIGLILVVCVGGVVGMVQGIVLVKVYNDVLFGGLKVVGLQVILVDIFYILQEIVVSLVVYGFINVISLVCIMVLLLICNLILYVNLDVVNNYVFVDGVYLILVIYVMLGVYMLFILEVLCLQQILIYLVQIVGCLCVDQVSMYFGGCLVDGLSWWGNLCGDMQCYVYVDLYDGMVLVGLFGVDWVCDGMVVGGFVGYGCMDVDFGNSQGDFIQFDIIVGLFVGWYGECVWVNGQVSYSWLDYDVICKLYFGLVICEYKGLLEGSNLIVVLNVGYEFGNEGGFCYGLVVVVIWQKVKLDGYIESNVSVLVLGYGDQDLDFIVGCVGWQVCFDGGNVKLYLQVIYDYEFEDGKQVSVWLQMMLDVGMYKVLGLEFDKDYVIVVMGVCMILFGLNSNVGISIIMLQKCVCDVIVFVSFSGSF